MAHMPLLLERLVRDEEQGEGGGLLKQGRLFLGGLIDGFDMQHEMFLSE